MFFKKTENKYEPLGCFTYLIDFKTNFHIVSLTINQNDFLVKNTAFMQRVKMQFGIQ